MLSVSKRVPRSPNGSQPGMTRLFNVAGRPSLVEGSPQAPQNRHTASVTLLTYQATMRDDFENIRAERDVPAHRMTPQSERYSGLWKQIALGVFVGFGLLGATGMLAWFLLARIALSSLQFNVP